MCWFVCRKTHKLNWVLLRGCGLPFRDQNVLSQKSIHWLNLKWVEISDYFTSLARNGSVQPRNDTLWWVMGPTHNNTTKQLKLYQHQLRTSDMLSVVKSKLAAELHDNNSTIEQSMKVSYWYKTQKSIAKVVVTDFSNANNGNKWILTDYDTGGECISLGSRRMHISLSYRRGNRANHSLYIQTTQEETWAKSW